MPAELLDPASYLVTIHSIGPWVVGTLTAVLGIVLLLRERGSNVSLALCLLTTSVSIWLLSAGALYATRPEPLALRWAKAANFGVVFIPSAVFIFTLTIAQRLREFQAVAWGSLTVSGLFYVGILATDRFLAGLYRYDWGYYSRYGPLGLLFLVRATGRTSLVGPTLVGARIGVAAVGGFYLAQRLGLFRFVSAMITCPVKFS